MPDHDQGAQPSILLAFPIVSIPPMPFNAECTFPSPSFAQLSIACEIIVQYAWIYWVLWSCLCRWIESFMFLFRRRWCGLVHSLSWGLSFITSSHKATPQMNPSNLACLIWRKVTTLTSLSASRCMGHKESESWAWSPVGFEEWASWINF
jgi:hypothetical protein